VTKRALITGITGQDGSYLAEFLLSRGYEVHGVIRRASTFNTRRLDHIYQDPHHPGARMFLHYGDLMCSEPLTSLIYNVRPDEIYHLGAQSHVMVSFETPEFTGEVTGLGTTRILDAIRRSGIRTRFYQASSSEMFGNAPAPQSETTPFQPRSPYAAAKVYAFWMAANYRQAYGLFASNGILFNHESPRRGETFVTRKITRAVAMILAGRQRKLFLGNLKSRRDWGYAPEYVECMWRILQQDAPGDFVAGTGQAHSVEEFVGEAFAYVNLDWRAYVETDTKYFRPAEADCLVADARKAQRELQWQPRVTFRELVRIMVDADMEEVGLQPVGEGRGTLAAKFKDWHRWGNSVTEVVQAAAGRALGD
jgi:GDPmannose 4,6-dehydratase